MSNECFVKPEKVLREKLLSFTRYLTKRSIEVFFVVFYVWLILKKFLKMQNLSPFVIVTKLGDIKGNFHMNNTDVIYRYHHNAKTIIILKHFDYLCKLEVVTNIEIF